MINRRCALLAGAGAGLLLPRQAAADSLFTDFAFSAFGAPTLRTMPVRLAEIHNVLDFGADPTGGNASTTTAAVQAAVDVISGTGRGTVFFPLGSYATNAAITFNTADLSINFRGEGAGTTVSGNFNGFIFDRHLGSPSNTAFVNFEKLSVVNSSTGGSSGCIRLGSTTQGTFRDMGVSGFVCITTEDTAGVSSQNIFLENCSLSTSTSGTGTTGLIIGAGGAMVGCDFTGADFAVKAYGSGLFMAGQRIENCNTAYQFGLDSAGTNAGMSGFTVAGSTEGNITGLDMAGTCTGGFIGPLSFLGHTTSGPGQNMHSLYGLRVRADMAQACVFYNVFANGCDTGGIAIANATARANNVFVGCLADVGTGMVAWVPPTNAFTAQFVQCNLQPVWTYTQLPTGGNVLEGDEFNISDPNSATWGANVTASGASGRVLVRWNGSNWTVVGK